MTNETKHVERYQLIISVLIVLGSIAVSWKNTDNRISVLEIQRKIDDTNTAKIEFKLDKIIESQQELKINLENKKDREK